MNCVQCNNQIENQIEDKGYLVKLAEQLEDLIEQDINLPFHLKQIKDNGFLIKVRGLYAFVSFGYMPWRYKNKESWNAVFESIKGKQFYGRVYQLTKDPLFVLFNAQVSQFKCFTLVPGEFYNGILIAEDRENLQIDFGYHFNWKCGSIIGVISKKQLQNNQDIDNLQLGRKIQAFYFGIDKKEQRRFFFDKLKLDWLLKIPEEFIGKIVNAEIVGITKNLKMELLIAGKYRGKLTDLKGQDSYQFKQEFIEALKDFSVGDTISCRVVGADASNQILQLNLNRVFVYKDINDDSIYNRLNFNLIETFKPNLQLATEYNSSIEDDFDALFDQ